ncbi:MAG: 3-isopropylmalate dehydratase large subunit [Rhodospirillales bacterium]|nr:3-isopropylmalate dehydratase large subunit [Rhodospirillales bacterium]MBO6786313.1 3-isopropylmalate dehydratase large subunit [Rhodospirillales bacterium]
MAQTLAEKIIANAAGLDSVAPGEIVTCQVDLAMMHDSAGPRMAGRKLDELGVPVWDLDKLVVITDHYINDDNPEHNGVQKHAYDWVMSHGIKNFIKEQGICHIVLPEGGHVKPGMFIVGGDSHSVTGGAFGTIMVGIGATEMTGVLATGEIWVRVPETVKVDITGNLKPGVSAKDVILKLCGDHGIMGFNYQALEYGGEAVSAMSVEERMTLANMAAELGAKAGYCEPDEKTEAVLTKWGATGIDIQTWRSDPDASYAKTVTVSGDALSPQVAAPSSPENAAPVEAHQGTKLDQAYLGACTGAKLDDLRMAAQVLKGRKVQSGFKFMISPSSLSMQEEARADGTLQILEDAGGVILPMGCSGCIGIGPARLEENAVGISSTNRNFVGRAGPKSSKLFLASPYTVAASAIKGAIADPREFL